MCNFNKRIAFLFAFVISIVVGFTSAQAAGNQNFKMTAQPSALQVKAGQQAAIRLTLTFQNGYHTYGTRKIAGPDGLGPEQTKITVAPTSAFKAGKIKTPKPTTKFDEGFEINVDYYYGTVVFEIPVTAKKDIDFSKDKIDVNVYLQQCTETECLPPDNFKTVVNTKTYESPFTKSLATAAPDTSTTETADAAENQTDTANKQATVAPASKSTNKQADAAQEAESGSSGLLATLLISMLAGFGAFITPCVFPMVPITVSFFTKRSEQNKGKGLRDAVVYALGIIITFTMIGVLFSLLLGPTGVQDMAASPWFNLAIVVLFLFFGFSLFGAYELQLPTSWSNKLNTKSDNASGIGAVLLMSVTFAVTSFSCTGPLIGAALVSAASGAWFYPMVSMLGFSTTLAAPFFLLALFPSALNKMPKAGGWMNNVKVILGFIVLAITLKYLNNALVTWNADISRTLFLAIWAAIFFLCTIYILGLFKTSLDAPVNNIGTTRLMFALAFGAITFYIIAGLVVPNKQLGFLESMLPAIPESEMVQAAPGAPAGTAGVAAVEWMHSYKDALADAKAKGRNLLVDFTGKTCTNCKVMEKRLYPDPQVQATFAKFTCVKLYTDVPENRDIQLKKFNSVALPLYAIINPNDESVIASTAFMDKPDEFVKFLSQGVK